MYFSGQGPGRGSCGTPGLAGLSLPNPSLVTAAAGFLGYRGVRYGACAASVTKPVSKQLYTGFTMRVSDFRQ